MKVGPLSKIGKSNTIENNVVLTNYDLPRKWIWGKISHIK